MFKPALASLIYAYSPCSCFRLLQPFWYFGAPGIIRDRLFTNPAWTAVRGTGRDKSDEGSYYASKEAERLDKALKEKYGCPQGLDDPHTSTYEVGYDYVNMFTFKNHSTGVVVIR